MLERFLNTLVTELGLGTLPPKEEGQIYKLTLNPGLTLTLKELDPGVSFWGQIGPCPALKKEELFTLLMKANFLGQGTAGSTIALDENENFLTLSLVLPYDMSYKIFRDTLEDFANIVDYWKEELIRHQREAEISL